MLPAIRVTKESPRARASLQGLATLRADEHDLARHASRAEQLVCVSGLDQGESPRDERLDLLLLKQGEERDQIRAKPGRSDPFEPLDAVGDHAFAAREQPAAGDVHPEDRDATKAMTAPRTTRRQAPLAQHARQAIGHDPSPRTESLAGAPDVGAADAVEDVHALVREAANLLHEVGLSVVDRGPAQLRDGRRPAR